MKNLNYKLIALHLIMGLFLILTMEWIAPLFNWTFIETSLTQGQEAAIQNLEYSANELFLRDIYGKFAAVPLTFILSFVFSWVRKEGKINPFIVLVLTFLLCVLYGNSSISIAGLPTPFAKMLFNDLKSIFIFNASLFLIAGLFFLGLSGTPRRIIKEN